MIKADDFLSVFVSRLLDDDFFRDIQITHAYPNSIKHTVLKNAVVAYGIKGIEVDESSVGEDIKSGTISIFTDIYTPYSFNKAVPEKIVFRICSDTADMNIASISVDGITAEPVTECYVMRAVFTFYNEISFGREVNE